MNDALIRLKKISGQLSGLMKMIEEGQDCEKIIIQFQAAKAALDTAFAQVVAERLDTCIQKKDSAAVKKLILLSLRNR